MCPMSASQSRTADSTSVLSTVCKSKVDRLITLSTSAVAVCCCSDSQLVKQAGVLDGNGGLRREVCDQGNLLVGEWPDFLSVDGDTADQQIVLKHGYRDQGSRAGQLYQPDGTGIALPISGGLR